MLVIFLQFLCHSRRVSRPSTMPWKLPLAPTTRPVAHTWGPGKHMSPCFFCVCFSRFLPWIKHFVGKIPWKGGVFSFLSQIFPGQTAPTNPMDGAEGQRGQAMLFGEDVAFGGVFRRGAPWILDGEISTELGSHDPMDTKHMRLAFNKNWGEI